MRASNLLACIALTALGCGPDDAGPRPVDAGVIAQRGSADASFSQAAGCDAPPPRRYEPLAPSGPWPTQIGVPVDAEPFELFGAGCDIPVVGTIQGKQYALLAVRFPETESPLVYARFTLSSLENPSAETVRDVNYNVKQRGLCRSDGYCYISPILANIVDLADVQDQLRDHEVAISVHLFEAGSEQRFGRNTTWGRLRFPDEDEINCGPDAGRAECPE